jgi:hypothetical protein
MSCARLLLKRGRRRITVLGKMRLFVRVRAQGSRIESVPLKRLLELSNFRKKRWEFRDGWLVLEAF